VTRHAANSNTIIFVRLPNWVGDVCMSLPSLALLAHTGCRLVVCAKPWAKELLCGHPAVRDFIPMTGRIVQDRQAVRQMVRQMGKHNIRGLLLPDSLTSALVFRLAAIPSAGYRDDGRSLLLRWPLNKPKPDAPAPPLHAVQSWHHLTCCALRRWQLPVPEAQPSQSLNLPLTDAHQQQARQALAAAGLTPQRFILIAPTATGLHKGRVKIWPGFRALTQALEQHPLARSLPVVMCPPAAEAEQARAAVSEARILAPLPLGAFAALVRMAALVVCNDSGVSHLAAAVQAPQLTLFGVTQPERTGPWSTHARCLGAMNAWPQVQAVLEAVLDAVLPTQLQQA